MIYVTKVSMVAYCLAGSAVGSNCGLGLNLFFIIS